MRQYHWEDFQTGEEKHIGKLKITADEITAFAKHYDPQPFHLSEELAKGTFVGRLCASGWHVITLFSKLAYLEEQNIALVDITPHIEECRWMKPVYPEDELSCVRICLNREDEPDCDYGRWRFRWNLFDQLGVQKTQITAWLKIKKRSQ